MKIFLLIAKVLLIVGLIVWTILNFDLDKAQNVIESANLIWGALAIVLIALTYFLYTFRWKKIIHGYYPDNGIKILSLYWYGILSLFYNLFIPTVIAGEAARTLKIRKYLNNDLAKSTIIVTLDRLLGAFLWTLIYLLSPSPFKNNRFWIIFAVFLILFSLFRKKIVLWEHRIFDFSMHHSKDIAKAVIYSLSGQLVYITAVACIFRCFGIQLSILETSGIVAASSLIGSIPICWLGVSLREGSYIGLLSLYGVSSTQGLLVTSFFIFSNYFFGLIAGFIELAQSGWNFSSFKIPQEEVSDA